MNKTQLEEKIKQYVAKRLKEMSTTGGGAAGQYLTKYAFSRPATKKEKTDGMPAVFMGDQDKIYAKYGYRKVKPSEMIDAKFLWKEGVEKVVDIDPNDMDDIPSIEVTLVDDGEGHDPDAFFKMSAMYHSGDNGKMEIFKNNPGLQKAVTALLQKEFQKTFRKVIHGVLGEPFGLDENNSSNKLWKESFTPKKALVEAARAYKQFKEETQYKSSSRQYHNAIKHLKKKVMEIKRIVEFTSQLKTELSEVEEIKLMKRSDEVLNQLQEEIKNLRKQLKSLK